MQRMAPECIDLIYLDPPFRTNRSYFLNKLNGEWGSVIFHDHWEEGILQYINWLYPRLKESKRLLKTTGSVYLHCDTHASHYLKVTMDQIFGQHNFRNEIIWKRKAVHNGFRQGARHFGRIHDTILFYSKSDLPKWNEPFTPYSQEYIEGTYRYVEPHTGRRYALGDLTGPGGPSKSNPQYMFMGVRRYWRYSRSKMNALRKQGKIVQNRRG